MAVRVAVPRRCRSWSRRRGGSQALSRSLFASMPTPQGEVVGVLRLLGVFEKFAGIFRTCAFRDHGAVHRIEPARDPLRDRASSWEPCSSRGWTSRKDKRRRGNGPRRLAELAARPTRATAGPRCARRAGFAGKAARCAETPDPVARLGPRERVLQRVSVERHHCAPELLRLRLIAVFSVALASSITTNGFLLVGAGERRERGLRVAGESST